LYFDGIILDEYAQMQPRLFGEVIAPTLIDRQGWVVFIGTPAGMNHFYELWEDAANDPNWFRLMLRASESGIIAQADLDRLKTLPGSDEDTYNQEFECDFNAANKGSYYGKLIVRLEPVILGAYPYDPDYRVLTAWDLGYSDDTSVWFYQTDGRLFRFIDFFTVSGYSVEDVLGVLRKKPFLYGLGYVPHDAKNKSFQTGKSTRELMFEAGFKTILMPNMGVQDGIQAVRATLPFCRFDIGNPNIKEGIDALKMYHRKWDEKKQAFMETPDHDWSSNPADAFRTFAMAMNPQAAKEGARSVAPGATPSTPPGNVLCLENLFADRKRRRGGRI
jgi:hypothetical protein